MNYTLMNHQISALEKALQYPAYAFFHDTGTGKTLLGIEIIKQKSLKKALVVCPLSIIEGAWMYDFQKFAPCLVNKTINLWVLGKKKKSKTGAMQFKYGLANCQICIVNFEGFKSYQAEIEKENFGLLIIDESSKIKSIKSQITKRLIKYAETRHYVYLFSGTPAPNTELEYFTQIRAISKEPFGRSFYAFRTKYFYPTGYGGYKWEMKKNMRLQFLENLSAFSEVVSKDDVLDLPERTDNIRNVLLSDSEKDAYENMRKHFTVEFEKAEFLATTAVTKIMKLRELTSGFIMGEGECQIIGKSKLMALLELIEEIGKHQTIIWVQFHVETERIMDAMINKTWGRIDGTVPQERKDDLINAFKEGKLQYLIAHPRSLAHGHTFVNCNYAIYFSLSYSLEEFYQSKDRIYRKGQENKCSYYYLLAKKSIDEIIYQTLLKKADIVTEVFNYIKKRNTT